MLVLVTAVSVWFLYAPKNVKAEEFSEKKLQYFKLEKPVDVFREDQTVYIAQKDLIVIYYDDTYRTVKPSTAYYDDLGEQKEFDISSMAKCGNALLFLSDGELYSLELSSFKISKTPLITNVSAFSVKNDILIASLEDKQIVFYEYQSSNVFSDFEPDSEMTVNGSEAPSSLALADISTTADGKRTATYYFGSENMLSLVKNHNILNVSRQTPTTALEYADGKLYVRAETADDDVIYLCESDNALTPVISLNENGLSGARGFFVSNGKMLVCDTERDRIVEYDLTSKSFTDFEISFTKIDLPENFEITKSEQPTYITVANDSPLYNVNLTKSAKNGYFVFGGSYKASATSSETSEYLVCATVGSDYYLILGKCMALVLKDDYAPTDVVATDGAQEELVFANDCNVYKLPYKTAEKSLDGDYDSESDALFFKAFGAKKGTQATVLRRLTLRDTEFAYVTCEEGSGYLPYSCLMKKPAEAAERKSFTTATTAKKATTVYSDKQLTDAVAELGSYSEVLVYSTEDGVCYISYGDDNYGYVKQTSIVKKGDYVKRVVAVVALLALSICITAIFFEKKYLYSKNKKN